MSAQLSRRRDKALEAEGVAWEFILRLPQILPTQNSRMHWAERARLVRSIRDVVYLQGFRYRTAMAAPVAHEKRRLTLTLIRGPRQRLLDIDGAYAALKSVVDGLKDAGWIVDDAPPWLDYTAHQEVDRAVGPAVRVEIGETK